MDKGIDTNCVNELNVYLLHLFSHKTLYTFSIKKQNSYKRVSKLFNIKHVESSTTAREITGDNKIISKSFLRKVSYNSFTMRR